ncbi:MAG: hypothetical protein ACI4DK_13135 [Lachnospiraceae bacterium]
MRRIWEWAKQNDKTAIGIPLGIMSIMCFVWGRYYILAFLFSLWEIVAIHDMITYLKEGKDEEENQNQLSKTDEIDLDRLMSAEIQFDKKNIVRILGIIVIGVLCIKVLCYFIS